MSNPYDPPKSSGDADPSKPSFYAGGLNGVALASVIIGGIVGRLLDIYIDSMFSLGIPAIGWLVATSLLVYWIGDSNLTEDGKVLSALLLPIPAYILYVPVCVVSSIGTMPILGERGYGPSSSGAIVASAFAFFVVLMLIAVIVQVKYKVRDSDARKRPND